MRDARGRRWRRPWRSCATSAACPGSTIPARRAPCCAPVAAQPRVYSSWRCSRWRSALVPTPPSSPCSTSCCSGRCGFPSPPARQPRAPGPKPGSSTCNAAGSCDVVFSYPMFRDLERAQNGVHGYGRAPLIGANLAVRAARRSTAEGMLVSGSYFPALGLRPALGRLIGPATIRAPGERHVSSCSATLLADALRRQPRRRSNETLIVNGQPMTIVGVAPQRIRRHDRWLEPKVFVPITLRAR